MPSASVLQRPGRRGRVGGTTPAPPWAGDYSVGRSIVSTIGAARGYTSESLIHFSRFTARCAVVSA